MLQVAPAANLAGVTNLFRFAELQAAVAATSDGAHDIAYEDLHPAGLNAGEAYRRLIACTRTYYRPDDLGAAAGNARALLGLGRLESLGLVGASYRLAFTPGLLARVFQRGGALLPAPAAVLGSLAGDGGGYVDLDGDGRFWIPSGRSFFLAGAPATPAELNQARANFFLARRFEDPFVQASLVTYDAPHNLLLARATDPMGNTLSAVNDYRALAPTLLTDANGNRSAVSFDALGLVVATAVMGKAGENLGDVLNGFPVELSQAQTDALYTAADPVTLAAPLLGNATTRIVYDINRFYRTRAAAPNDPTQWLPAFSAILARETHISDLAPGAQSRIQISFSYSDGFGREIQKKAQAEPGPVVDGGPNVAPRWVGTGWTVFNNKGKPVRQYEPFFSQLPKGHQFEFSNKVGVSPILGYDPAERPVATLHPDHSYEKVVFEPWRQESWNANDTVAQDDPATDPDVGGFFQRLPAADYLPTWRVQRAGGAMGALEQDAATKAAAHANTPSVSYFDALGRAFLTVADNGAAGKYLTHIELDIQNYQRSLTDALGRKVMTYDYGLPGEQLDQASMEAGERWTLKDAAGQVIRAWDSRGHNFRTAYDALRRPLQLFVQGTDAANSDPRTLGGEKLIQKTEYGENQANDQEFNLRTRVFRTSDSAGVVKNLVTDPVSGNDVGYDFKGNSLGASRQFVRDYAKLPDWAQPAPGFLPELHVSTTQYDALNRVIAARTPDGSVAHPVYNQANLLESVSVNLLGAAQATSFINNLDYNAKGQRILIEYGDPGASFAATAYSYDPLTFRLANLTTTRTGLPAAQQPAQALTYTYDPTGNITHIQDAAQRTTYFNNQVVTADGDYTYDALYRLIQASGREQLGLQGGVPNPPWPSSYNDVPHINLPHPGDGQAMGTYTEQYHYDQLGNFLALIHTGSNPANPGWTRSYIYNEPSQLEPGKVSNRLSSSQVAGNQPLVEPYSYDLHGNMTSMPQLQALAWDYKDHLQMTRRQAVNAADADGAAHAGERSYCVYDASGQRVRKVTESAGGIKIKERLYLGMLEIYREFDAAGAVTLERQSLHVMDDKKRVALVETKTVDATLPPNALAITATRFQFDNLIGTACLELDPTGAVITYEEYSPYGCTSYQAGRSVAEVSLKRYRYLGKERDEETGLCYHGARYYACWIGRWTAVDPKGLVDGSNLYFYARDNPIRYLDKTGADSNDSVQAAQQNLGLSNPAQQPQQPVGTKTTEFTLQGSGTTRVAPQAGPTSSLTLLTHVRFRLSPEVEFGILGGFGGTFPLPFTATPDASNAIGTGSLAATLHVGQEQSSDDSVRSQTLHGGYFALGNVWGQSPQVQFLPWLPSQQSTDFNPYGSAMYALSHLRNLENPRASDEDNKKLIFHSFEFDLNLSLLAQRYGSINGVTVDALVSPTVVANLALATENQVTTYNLEVLGGLNVAKGVDTLDPAAQINQATPVSGRIGIGLGIVHTFGDYSIGIEAVLGKELAPTVGQSLNPSDPTAGPNTGWHAGAWTFGLNLGLSAINRPDQQERDFRRFLGTTH